MVVFDPYLHSDWTAQWDTSSYDCSHQVTKAEDATILDVKVDVAVGDLNAANDLACVDMGDAGPLVGVRVGVDSVCMTHSRVNRRCIGSEGYV